MKSAWQTALLGDLTEPDAPITYGVVKPGHEGDVLFVRGGDILDGRILEDALRTITSEVSQQYKRTLLRGGELLISLVGRPGQVAVAGLSLSGANIARQVGLIRLRREVDAQFISYFLRSPDGIAGLGKFTGGSVQQVINLGDLRQVRIPLPLIADQRRIVAILDEAFEGIATARANAEKNLLNIRELFSSRMQVLFGQDEVWERIQLAELLERRWITSHLDGNHGSDYPSKEEFVDAGVPYIAASAIKGGVVAFDEAKYLSLERAASIRKGLAKDRDVLFAHNATVGPVAVLRTDEDVVILGTSLTYYRCDPQYIHPEYLAHFMLSPAFTSQYAQVMKQSTRNQVPITKQREFFHVIPPIDVQRRIADELDELAAQAERLTDINTHKLAAINELKKSLLHQAFSGAL